MFGGRRYPGELLGGMNHLNLSRRFKDD